MAKKLVKGASKTQFGAGIDALFGGRKIEEAMAENPREVVEELASHFAMIPLREIEPNPDQPRSDFDPEALEELAESIKIHGIIQPLTLRRLAPHQYQIISGERRFRASRQANLEEVPAFIRMANDQELLEMALIENIQREDLNAMEVAYSYYRLKNEFSLTDENLSERVGKKRSTVTNYLRLLNLHPQVQDMVKGGQLSMGHARAIAGVEDKLLQKTFAEEVHAREWSVRQTEAKAKSYQPRPATQKKAGSARKLTPDQERVRKDFQVFFGTPDVQLVLEDGEKGSGHITIKFKSYEQLNEMFKAVEQ